MAHELRPHQLLRKIIRAAMLSNQMAGNAPQCRQFTRETRHRIIGGAQRIEPRQNQITINRPPIRAPMTAEKLRALVQIPQIPIPGMKRKTTLQRQEGDNASMSAAKAGGAALGRSFEAINYQSPLTSHRKKRVGNTHAPAPVNSDDAEACVAPDSHPSCDR